MTKIQFFPKLTAAKRKELSDLYYALDILIVTAPAHLNPMTVDGFNCWDWGVVRVNGVDIPAPYKEVGYDIYDREYALESKYSAYTNLLVFLEMLYAYKNSDKLRAYAPMTNAQCSGAFALLDKWGDDKFHSIMQTLRESCWNDANAMRVID